MTLAQGSVLDVIHVGPLGAQPGGIAQVVNELNSWRWSTVQISAYTTTVGTLDLISPIRLIMCCLRIVARRLTKRPTVVMVHLSQRGSFIREGLVLLVARICGLPGGAHIHGSSFVPFAQRHPRLVSTILLRADLILTLTDQTTKQVNSIASRDRLPRVVQIVNAVSMPEFSAAKRPEVVFCGVVGRRKGVHVLLRAWKDLGQLTEGWTLRLLGPGDVNALGVEPLPSNISVEGAVSRSAALTAQAQASIAVLPSFLEALPMFLIEAMSRGCAVISTDVGQILELVGESGLIVPAGDSDKLASALRRLMSDESTRLALGQAARERVKDNYSSDKVQRTLEKEWWKMARKYDDTSIGRDGDE